MNSAVAFMAGVVLGGVLVHLVWWLARRRSESIADYQARRQVTLPAGLQLSDGRGRVFEVTVDHTVRARDTRSSEDD